MNHINIEDIGRHDQYPSQPTLPLPIFYDKAEPLAAAETIDGVAIRYDGHVYSLPRPNRHHHVIRLIASENGVGIQGSDEQGFVTNTGRFVGRVVGLQVALAANQVLDVSNVRAGRLYSEDLW